MRASSRGVLPGFGLSMGVTVVGLSLVVLLPLSALFLKTLTLDRAQFLQAVTGPRALAAYRLSFGASLLGASLNAVFGFLVAWVLVRYEFPGRKALDALVDLPFALPTAVAGIALTALYAPTGWIGRLLAPLGVQAVFNPLGIVVALTFIGLPFVVRTLQPVLETLDPEIEKAAVSLGANRRQTFFKVLLPSLYPAWITGFTLAFARALGEYGSVVFISGNMPLKTEIVPLLIITRLEQYDYAGATALAVVMLTASFTLLLLSNRLQAWAGRFRDR